MVDMNRRFIRNYLMDIDVDYFEGSLDDIILKLGGLKEKFKNYSNLRIGVTSSYEGYGITLIGKILENDEMYTNRIIREEEHEKQIANSEKNKIKAEQALYRKLKKKYEK